MAHRGPEGGGSRHLARDDCHGFQARHGVNDRPRRQQLRHQRQVPVRCRADKLFLDSRQVEQQSLCRPLALLASQRRRFTAAARILAAAKLQQQQGGEEAAPHCGDTREYDYESSQPRAREGSDWS